MGVWRRNNFSIFYMILDELYKLGTVAGIDIRTYANATLKQYMFDLGDNQKRWIISTQVRNLIILNISFYLLILPTNHLFRQQKSLMIISAGKRMRPSKVKTKDTKTKNQYTPNTPITDQHQKNQEENQIEKTPQHPYHPHRRYHLLIRR